MIPRYIELARPLIRSRAGEYSGGEPRSSDKFETQKCHTMEGMRREDFFDLAIATVGPGEAPPADADVARVLEPSRREVAARAAEGWFYKPCYVTYLLRIPESLDAYIQGSFRAGTRNKPRRLLRDVPSRYRLAVET